MLRGGDVRLHLVTRIGAQGSGDQRIELVADGWVNHRVAFEAVAVVALPDRPFATAPDRSPDGQPTSIDLLSTCGRIPLVRRVSVQPVVPAELGFAMHPSGIKKAPPSD